MICQNATPTKYNLWTQSESVAYLRGVIYAPLLGTLYAHNPYVLPIIIGS